MRAAAIQVPAIQSCEVTAAAVADAALAMTSVLTFRRRSSARSRVGGGEATPTHHNDCPDGTAVGSPGRLDFDQPFGRQSPERGSVMTRVSPASPEQYVPLFGEDAPLRLQVYAQRPPIASKFAEFGRLLRDEHVLPARLLELVRLRVAFHNQCRSCMAVRYRHGIEDQLTEELVCSLERPQEAGDLTEAERAAIAYADLIATDHLAVSDETFARLREHFGEAEIMELCFHVAFYVGFGRMGMSLDMVDDLPEGFREGGEVAPWRQPEVVEAGGPTG